MRDFNTIMKTVIKTIMVAVPFIALALIAGCRSSGFGAADKQKEGFYSSYVDNNPKLPEDVKAAILEGKIIPGMAQKVIKDIYGEPEVKYVSQTWIMEVWFYAESYVGFNGKGKVVKSGSTEEALGGAQ